MNKTLHNLQKLSAKDIIKKYHDPNMVPVDIVDILKKLNVQLTCVDFSQLEQTNEYKDIITYKGHIMGSIHVKDNDELNIYYKPNLSKEESRMIIAYELAEACLKIKNHNSVHITCFLDICNPLNKELSTFAEKLLIPKKVLNRLCSTYELIGKYPDAKKLAEIFVVPLPMMVNRLDDLYKSYVVKGELHD